MQSLARRALIRAAALENVEQCSFWSSKFEHLQEPKSKIQVETYQ